MAKQRRSRWFLAGWLIVAACGDADDESEAGVETQAPTCASLVGDDPRELFRQPVVSPDAVLASLVLGDMDPAALDPFTFELGFLLDGLNVPVTAPADLYVHAIEYTDFLTGARAGERDYSLNFSVCSHDDGTGAVAVEGVFAHVTSLESELLNRFSDAQLSCERGEGNGETIESCGVRYFPARDERLMIPAGTLIGGAGGTGKTAYRPGFDFNLLDERFPNAFVNPERLGSDDGPGRWYRYGACVYEYFAEPWRAEYLSRVGRGPSARRVSRAAPCGRLEIDVAGTAAGLWIEEQYAGLDVNRDLIQDVTARTLVLAPSVLQPETHQVISAASEALSRSAVGRHLWEMQVADAGDINRRFEDMQPGQVHCLDATAEGAPAIAAAFVLEVLDERALRIERVSDACSTLTPAQRIFSAAALTFVR